jgi:HEAT repeat protein
LISFNLLVGGSAVLFTVWLALAVWIVGGRIRDDRLFRGSADGAIRLAGGSLHARRCRRKTLWRIADGEPSEGAAEAARELVRRETPALVRLAKERRYERTHALRVLVRGKSPHGFELLRRARGDRMRDVTAAVVAIAGEDGSADADELLIDLLVDGDHPRSRTATELAPRAPRLLNRLLALVGDSDTEVRYWALMLLRATARDPRVRAAAVEAATDAMGTVRAAAARLLGAGDSVEVAPVLRAMMTDDVFFVRAHAARAAGEIGADLLARDLALLLADENWWVRAAAKESLVALGPSGMAAASAMLEVDDSFARDGAAEVVSTFLRLAQMERRVR